MASEHESAVSPKAAKLERYGSRENSGRPLAVTANQFREGCAGAMLERDAFGENLKSSPCAPRDRCRASQSLARISSALTVARIASGQKLKPRPCLIADSDRQGVRSRDA